MTPGVLTREQVERLLDELDSSVLSDGVAVGDLRKNDATLRATITQQAQELQAIKDTVGDTEFALRQQLAASQARCREMERDKEQAVYALGQLEEKYLQLQATLAAREAVIEQQEATIKGYRHSIKIIGQQHDGRKAERDAAVQEAGRLKEAAGNLTCEVCKMDMQRAQQSRGSSGGAANQGAGT